MWVNAQIYQNASPHTGHSPRRANTLKAARRYRARCQRSTMDKKAIALLELGRLLRRWHYRFVTPTPETHRAVNCRDGNGRKPSGRNSRRLTTAARPPNAEG